METQTEQRERERKRASVLHEISLKRKSSLSPSILSCSPLSFGSSLCISFLLFMFQFFFFFYLLVVVRKLFLSLQKLLSNLVGDERRDRTERIVQKNKVFFVFLSKPPCVACVYVWFNTFKVTFFVVKIKQQKKISRGAFCVKVNRQSATCFSVFSTPEQKLCKSFWKVCQACFHLKFFENSQANNNIFGMLFC